MKQIDITITAFIRFLLETNVTEMALVWRHDSSIYLHIPFCNVYSVKSDMYIISKRFSPIWCFSEAIVVQYRCCTIPATYEQSTLLFFYSSRDNRHFCTSAFIYCFPFCIRVYEQKNAFIFIFSWLASLSTQSTINKGEKTRVVL